MYKIINGYDGQAYFWNFAYRHSLRDCSAKARRQVRAAFIRAGLDLIGLTSAHTEIVLKYTAKDPVRVRKMGASEDYKDLHIPNSLLRVKPFGA